MKRRVTTSRKATKARCRKSTNPKRRSASKVARVRHLTVAGNDERIALLTRERDEALEQQRATSEVLAAISSTQGDVTPVFRAMVAKAVDVCDAQHGTLWLREGESFRAVALHGGWKRWRDERARNPLVRPGPASALGRVAATKRLVHILDIRSEKAYRDGDPMFVVQGNLTGGRTFVSVPMLKNGELIGAIGLGRRKVRAFTDKQIELVQNFAAQAVIAIENTRLLNELRQRTDDLTESLEQQTATSEVLRVISSSPGKLEPVFDAMLENAARICGAQFSTLWLAEGEGFRPAAMYNTPGALAKQRRAAGWRIPERDTALARVKSTHRYVHIEDLRKEPAYIERAPSFVEAVELGGMRTLLSMPMLKNDQLIGSISITRQEVRPFTDKQIALVMNFAAQAVIAIENTRLLNDLRDSLDRQTATSEVLKVISSSPGELGPVFTSILENATRICDAEFGTLFRYDGKLMHTEAQCGTPTALVEWQNQRGPFSLETAPFLTRVFETKKPLHILDSAENPNPATRFGGARSIVGVPMLKNNELVGAINIFRQEVRPFTDKQIELVTNFAAQAVIAIENTRLLNELRESLQQQTATADVLKVISSSPGELDPVFNSILENATRLCDASFGNLSLYEDGYLRRVATHNAPPAWAIHLASNAIAPRTLGLVYRAVDDKQVVHIADIADDHPDVPLAKLAGARTLLIVPMLKDDMPIGVVGIYRQEVRLFTDKNIELLKNFAAQAVIAIENTRLLNELRQRTDDLSEALEQQTATSEVLQVISRSPGELQPVFEAMLENATRICEGKSANLVLCEGDAFRRVSQYGATQELKEDQERNPILRPSPGHTLARLARSKRPVHIADVLAEPESAPSTAKHGGARTFVVVPMLKDDELVGGIGVYRQEVRPFTGKQIELLQNFAAQAVIAIENTRLLNELRQRTDDLSESLEQQTATSEVLKIISSSPGDLEPVFQTILENSTRICEAKLGTLVLYDNGEFRHVAGYGVPASYTELRQREPWIRPVPSPLQRVAETKQVIDVLDLLETPTGGGQLGKLAGCRSQLIVPMLKEGDLIGAIVIFRQEVRPFTDKQIDLVRNFAAQAVIAIENTRLLTELRQRTDDLSKSLDNLRTAQDRLVQTEKLASLGQLTAGIAHEIKNPLNFVNNFSALSVELIDELRQALAGVLLDSKLRGEINEIADMLQGNLDKVVQHGKRADSIVKNMLLHSRQGSGEHRPIDINSLVEESLNLAYHGARAEKQGFNITLEKSFDPAAGEVDLFPQEITRVLLNLISNGFYAATKRKAEANGGDYEPTLAAATKNLGDSIEIRIRDNGTGIPAEVKEKMFNPFFTTKPAGEGTGLGLSLSYDIIVKQHAGSIEVDTELGAFTEIRIVLPRTAASLAKSGGQA